MDGLEEKIFFITGAARGIGFATAKLLGEYGAKVVLTDYSEAVEQAAQSLRNNGVDAIGFQLDVRNVEEVEKVMEKVETEYGPVFGVVPAAGITQSGPAITMSQEAWQNVIDINLTGTFSVCRAAARKMLERKAGRIVMIGSVGSFGGQSGRVNYVATKWAIAGLTKSLAIEWGSNGLRVNAVCPNAVNTDMYKKGVPEEFSKNVIEDRVPYGRVAEVDEVAKAIVFLLSDAAAYINGVLLPVDGGLTAGFFTHRQGRDLALKP